MLCESHNNSLSEPWKKKIILLFKKNSIAKLHFSIHERKVQRLRPKGKVLKYRNNESRSTC